MTDKHYTVTVKLDKTFTIKARSKAWAKEEVKTLLGKWYDKDINVHVSEVRPTQEK